MDLEKVLNHLAQWGKPHLCQYDGGWHCSVVLFTAPAGPHCSASSDYKHATPLEAALCCKKHLEAILDVIIPHRPKNIVTASQC